MFEKEAKKWVRENIHIEHSASFGEIKVYPSAENGFQAGAEFGYNKANEWHYPSKGEYPKEYEDILICFLTEDDMKDCIRGWYEYDFDNNKHIFKYMNVLGTQYLDTVVAWKEIVLPKESE